MAESVEQLQLGGMEFDGTPEEEELKSSEPQSKLVAFGRFVKPEMYDVFGDYDLSSVTDKERLWLTPDHIAPFLFDKACGEKQKVDGLALNAHEYNLVARSPRSLAQTAVTRTLGDNDLSDERLAASQRSIEHTFASKREAMTTHVNKLEQRRSEIQLLRREAKAPGYAHQTPEHMKELISGAWQEFVIILDVLHIQRGWDDVKRARAEATMIHYLTQGSQSIRIGHWKAMLDLSDSYLGARVTLFKNRIKRLSK